MKLGYRTGERCFWKKFFIYNKITLMMPSQVKFEMPSTKSDKFTSYIKIKYIYLLYLCECIKLKYVWRTLQVSFFYGEAFLSQKQLLYYVMNYVHEFA